MRLGLDALFFALVSELFGESVCHSNKQSFDLFRRAAASGATIEHEGVTRDDDSPVFVIDGDVPVGEGKVSFLKMTDVELRIDVPEASTGAAELGSRLVSTPLFSEWNGTVENQLDLANLFDVLRMQKRCTKWTGLAWDLCGLWVRVDDVHGLECHHKEAYGYKHLDRD